MWKKKLLTVLLVMSFLLPVTGCGNGGALTQDPERLTVVTTIFPEYDWVKTLLGENPAGMELTMLLDNGVDLHSFQPTAEDIMRISNCDLFIYVGGESDAWVEDALKEVVNQDMIVLNLLDILGDQVKEEETVEGMEGEEEEEDETEYDEHVWLSLRNAEVLCEEIAEALKELDPANATVYEKNLEGYRESLADLDQRYAEAVGDAPIDTLVFGDRFPFRYLTDDYELNYYAAFSGCSAETEASFETVLFLAEKVEELSLSAVMTIDGTDHRIAETIVGSTDTKDQKILTLDSMQSTTSKDVEEGKTYLTVMEENLLVLKEALQ